MSCKVFVRPEAERDLASSYAFYQECRRGLGDDFLSSVEESFERISKNPFLYPDVHRGIRRALLRRFPCGVFYLVIDGRISVLAVLHAARDPDEWQARR
ncbi:type II toxin-antitoxin system RelE/ParE family toxin [Methyloversatilis sp. XJ19-49]|uniref:type II toxin-antitoxin system RelE/ParE family toxin n=1 Tax=Methyloversatilis sp. XJ19-49 TaxID=2963429 RepID=UPI00211C4927|nr:type II toxin-antitoxin system RelE/ParE family toxin [Methyloversatilis sp. XJ19-49]MCQ9379061.1 type II toxin-antitoxin system RelE/ParE family toxin [Methyloversatilis sp. XJ19-49]